MKQAAPLDRGGYIFNSESIALVRRAIIKTLNSENYHLVQSAIDWLNLSYTHCHSAFK